MPKTIHKTVYTFKELLAGAKRKNGRISQHAVEKARACLQEGATDHNWWEYIYEMWKQALEQVGFTDADISFSGFWSSGDGASFTSGLDCEKLLTFFSTDIEPKNCIDSDGKGGKNFLPYVVQKLVARGHGKTYNKRFADLLLVAECFSGRVTRDRYGGNYVHWNTCSTVIEYDPHQDETVQQLVDICIDDFVPEFEKAVEELRKDLCRVIYRELEAEHEYRTADEQLIEDSEANDYTFDESGDFEPA